MKILYLLNKNIVTPDFAISLLQAGYDVDVLDECECSYALEDIPCRDMIEQQINKYYRENNKHYTYIMSFNFIPSAAIAGNKYGIIYVSWMYDVWQMALYSEIGKLSTNRIFLMDSDELTYARSIGFENVYLLPLAVNNVRLSDIEITDMDIQKYGCDVSFVGGIYGDKSVNAYNLMKPYLDDSSREYIDSILETETGDWSKNTWFDKIRAIDLTNIPVVDTRGNTRADCLLDDTLYYTTLGFARTLTEYDRKAILSEVANRYDTRLYTYEKNLQLGEKLQVYGRVDYMSEMPKVFYCSRINLNITLRSIFSGISLRAFDIMGCGGFLISNRQKEMDMLFEDGTDYVAFDNVNDLIDKIGYYLSHEEERVRILVNGYNKIMNLHTYSHRLNYMFSILDKESGK